MRKTSLALAAASVCLLTASVMAAVPATPPATAPATAPSAPASATSVPATAPATAATAPAMTPEEVAAKDALTDFFKAMFAGDQQKAFGLLTYSDLDGAKPKNQATAEAMFGEILAEQRLNREVAAAFPADANKFDTGLGPAEVRDFTQMMGTATAKMNDAKNSVNVQMGLGSTFVVILKGNQWLVDFDKTQTNMGPMPTSDVPMLTAKAAAYNQIAEDVKNKKFASVDEVSKAVEKADGALAPAPATTASAPATAPKGPETQK